MLECKHGCGFKAETKRQLHPHENFHCPKIKSKKPEKKTAQVLPCECKDGGSWKLLNRRDHAAELDAGYTKYCTKCEEVI